MKLSTVSRFFCVCLLYGADLLCVVNVFHFVSEFFARKLPYEVQPACLFQLDAVTRLEFAGALALVISLSCHLSDQSPPWEASAFAGTTLRIVSAASRMQFSRTLMYLETLSVGTSRTTSSWTHAIR